MTKKALINTTQIAKVKWISSWTWNTETQEYDPNYSSIEDTRNVVEVVDSDKTFEVHKTLVWIDCPDDCAAYLWYYKDENIYIIPPHEPHPETNLS